MAFAKMCAGVFGRAVADYHVEDDVNAEGRNPFATGTVEHKLYVKCWIDAVQWHLEDIIRDPGIDPAEALGIKRRIDKSNQDRTDMVEEIDDWFMWKYGGVEMQPGAYMNTESPAWAVDRLSILELKLWHMREQAGRDGASEEHRAKCRARLAVLEEQHADLSEAIDRLVEDIAAGRRVMKTYKQMKMYNDPDTNPVLYKRG